MEKDPQQFLPLYRWLEAAGSLAPDQLLTHPWRWLMNLSAAFIAWAWRIFRVIGDLASSSSLYATGEGELATELPKRITDTTAQFIPIGLGVILIIFVWRVLIQRKSSLRESFIKGLVSIVFLALASTAAILALPAKALELVKDATDGVTEPVLEASNRQLVSLTNENSEPIEDDPLGCDAYIEELYHRSSEAHPLLRTLNTWMEWSYIPHWRNANYGVDAGKQADRTYCRYLEASGGQLPLEQALLTACAYESAIIPGGLRTETCSIGKASLQLGDNDPGPFRPANRTSIAEYSRQDIAWILCVRPGETPGSTWQLNQTLLSFDIEYPDPLGGGRKVEQSLFGINNDYNICQQWFASASNDKTQVCPPWVGGAGVCYRSQNNISANYSPSSDVEPTSKVFELTPKNITNWHDHPLVSNSADTLYSSSFNVAGVEQLQTSWDETRTWIVNRNSGGAGWREMGGLILGAFATMSFVPIILGLGGGVALSEILSTVILAGVPLLFLIGIFERSRKSFMLPVLRLLLLIAVSKIVLIWVMAVYTTIFWLVGSAVPFDYNSFGGLMWAAATPIVATALMASLLQSKPVKNLVKGDIGSVRGLTRLGGRTDEAITQTAITRTSSRLRKATRPVAKASNKIRRGASKGAKSVRNIRSQRNTSHKVPIESAKQRGSARQVSSPPKSGPSRIGKT